LITTQKKFAFRIARLEVLMDQPVPKVSVGIIAFNQGRYIRQALDSVLSQESAFDFDILVHDDCSTDGTREIVNAYVAAHPDRVRAILQDENQFSQGRRIILLMLPEMAGKYFALLDGDDFWTDRGKLQIQADFLDANPGCALCQTQTVYYDETCGRVHSIFPPRHRRQWRYECADLAQGNFIQTSAVMFRAAAVPQIPPAFSELKFGDLALFALIAQSGWIGNINAAMAVYRIHSSNLWFNRTRKDRIEATREVMRFLAKHLKPELRSPWAAAAESPRARLRPSLGVRGLEILYDVEDRMRRLLRLAPR
jgi:glycosyltransferase involved in cell wall biosynthesis